MGPNMPLESNKYRSSAITRPVIVTSTTEALAVTLNVAAVPSTKAKTILFIIRAPEFSSVPPK